MNVTPAEPSLHRIGSGGVRLLVFPCLVVLAACNPEPPEQRYRATGEVIAFGGGDGGAANACFSCHGLQGQGDGRQAPRLAGLDPGYLHRQLDDYANGRREHIAMRAVAIRLRVADREKVSAYYAALPVPVPATAPLGATTAGGKALYDSRCASCHGATGEGVGPGNPPLAGQPAGYLEAQLLAWRAGKRRGDGLNAMLAISRQLAPEEVRAVARHAAALPAPRPPAVPAASR